MATSPDGVLTATFDPARNLVSLLVDGAAWPVPGVLRTNLCPNPRYIGADGTTGGGSGTWPQVDLTSGAPDDGGYTRFTVDVAATGTVEIGTDVWAYASVTAGLPYTGSFYHRQSVAGGTQIVLSWLDSNDAQIGRTFGTALDAPADVWVRHHLTATAPAGAVAVAVRWYVPQAIAPAGATLDVAQRMLEQTDLLRPYFDGTYPDDGGLRYSWTSTENRSTSVEEWIYAVPDQVTITRAVDGASPIPVRGAEMSTAPGGTFVWSDNEAPLDASVVYTVQGYAGGSLVGTSTVTVSTTGAAWGVWVKVPGRPELTVRAPLVALDDETRETLGGSWQIPGGPRISQSGSGALAQSAGMGALTTALTLQAVDRTARAALDRAVRQAPGQVLLIQTGQPEELASGYYQAGQSTWSNPAQVRSDQYAKRYLTLPLTEAVMPAGPASGWTGVTYTDVVNAFATYQDIADAGLSYMDLATGEGWG